ncbi:hypothetical protein Tco_0866164 [Tanacetum coccineum]
MSSSYGRQHASNLVNTLNPPPGFYNTRQVQHPGPTNQQAQLTTPTPRHNSLVAYITPNYYSNPTPTYQAHTTPPYNVYQAHSSPSAQQAQQPLVYSAEPGYPAQAAYSAQPTSHGILCPALGSYPS